MSLPDLNTDEGRAAYRAELRAVGRPLRWGGLALIVLGAVLALGSRNGTLGLNDVILPVAYGALAIGWALLLAAIVMRTRHHRRRLTQGL